MIFTKTFEGMGKKRVVITGMGIVSCFGSDVNLFFKKLLAGESGVTQIKNFPCQDFPTRFAAPVRGFDPEGYLDKKQARRVDPFISYTIVAGKKALAMAGIAPGETLDHLDKKRCGILVGSGMGGMSVFYNGVEDFLTKGFRRITPFFVPYIISNMGSALLGIELGFMGPNYSISTACATGNYCIFSAAEHIRNGHADLMICGGAESPVNPIGVAGFVACRALSERNEDPTKASRPWDKKRDGFVIGEGAGVLILESLEHALERNATILGEYLGGAVNCDAHHMTDPREDGEGVALCMETALRDAGIAREKVNYINAHATSTHAGDLCEIRAIKKVFGPHVHALKINATKSMIGHCLGAAGGIEAIVTVQTILEGMAHPTINHEDPEEEVAGLNVIPGKPQPIQVTAAMSNSFGFGGHNSTLILAPYKL